MSQANKGEDDRTSVVAITATVGGPSEIVVSKGNIRYRLTTTSLLIQDALIPALLTLAKDVALELVEDTSVIRRVEAYSPGLAVALPSDGNYTVSRIATQRKPNGTDEHLEAFLKPKGVDEEAAYNVYDPFLQRLLLSAFMAPRSQSGPYLIYAVVKDQDIIRVTLGKDPGTDTGRL